MRARGAARALRRGGLLLSLHAALGAGCEGAASLAEGAAADEVAAAHDDGLVAATSHVDYQVRVALDEATGDGGPTLLRGWVTVAALTAMPCTDVAQRADPGLLQRLGDLIVAPAWAGHAEDGLPAWQVKGSQVIALHHEATALHGLASEQAESLCRLHLLLGRAEADAPTLAALPDDVTMSRMTLHLELAWADGRQRTVRTDVGWGDVLVASPALPAGDGEAMVTLRPGLALAAAATALDLATASEKDAGRAMLEALVETASVRYATGP